ncbi:winged helix-turn-helix domain-containing protein [Kitasatospora sp. MAP5-34]|uniref:winged helix-turn-helix domain-containing protein n=1 Tax=Kitasatospora sp. MAP5-34 TaxID=3035102 RepID=UPI0024766009|nr:winged helix-turn-helix domain-containing protein [Kitasatospora sp. MAP5-34]MDH6580367.1 DNA-binding response OmpR family regulator [Kitasatospora sp. MAP5-34]
MSLRYPRVHLIFSDRPTAVVPVRYRPEPADELSQPPLQAAGLVVDLDQRAVTAGGQPLELTYMEFELLAHLVARPLRVMSRRQLMDTVWGQPGTHDTRTVNTHIARIRRKLGPAHRASIATVRQIGYKFDPRLAPPGQANGAQPPSNAPQQQMQVQK